MRNLLRNAAFSHCCGAGGAAHLPGMVASMTVLPVLGVPVESKALSGMDSLLSIAQMPSGIPVGTLAIGTSGAKNAGLLAASIVALKDDAIRKRLEKWRAKQTSDVPENPTGRARHRRDYRSATRRYDRHFRRRPARPDGRSGGGPAWLQVSYFQPRRRCTGQQVSAAATTPRMRTLTRPCVCHAVDVVTFEFENVPDDTLAAISETVPVRPGVDALHVSQDRAIEKSFLNDHGIETAPWAPVNSAYDLSSAAVLTGVPAILKTARFGYDGKGQVRVDSGNDIAAAWDGIDNAPAVLEGFVDFEREISVIVARGIDGATQSYVPVDNVHRDHILFTTTAPSTVANDIIDKARHIAADIVIALDLVGLLAVEMFVLRDGDVLVNEIAPRPHNSGHWTLDGCAISQFEQFIRAVAGLPLGDPSRHSDAVMTNLIGGEAMRGLISWSKRACLHLYGKAESRPGRKMGHVTRLSPYRAVGNASRQHLSEWPTSQTRGA